MKYARRIILSFLLILVPAFFAASVSAMEAVNQSKNVFKFQQKLADKGNAGAQYKLATMYEAGLGTETNIELARQWYQQAADAGIKAASDRNIFLTVKAQGFKKAEHSAWLEGIKIDAENRKVEAMFLLGQLYHDGIGVKKDLNRSLALMTYVSSSGDVNVDNEIASIRDEIDAQNAIARKRQKQRDAKVAAVKQVKVEPVKAEPAKTAQTKEKQPEQQPAEAQLLAKKEQLIKAEKRRKYEKAMEQIRLEQQKIDELQSQVSGDEVAAIDDEI